MKKALIKRYETRGDIVNISFLDKWGAYISVVTLISAFGFIGIFLLSHLSEYTENRLIGECYIFQLKEVKNALDYQQLCNTEECKSYFQKQIDYYLNFVKNCEDLVKE